MIFFFFRAGSEPVTARGHTDKATDDVGGTSKGVEVVVGGVGEEVVEMAAALMV